MIDTKKLRRLAQAASHPETKGRWIRRFCDRTVYDRMDDGCRGTPIVSTDYSPPSLQEAAYLDFIAAANPATISELLDRLEAAERERDDIAEQLVRSEASRQNLSEAHSVVTSRLSSLADENVTLRAKIAEMGQQEPVAWLHETRRDSDVVTDAVKHVWGKVAVGSMAAYSIPLYALPGAQTQPAPSFADAYQGALAVAAIWKKRALEAEDLNRKFIAEINGPTHMGEPAQPAPSVPEVKP